MRNIGLVLLCIIASACSNDFLEKYPATSLNEGNFYNTQSDFVGLANGAYLPLRDYTKINYWVLAELSSDNGGFQERPDGGAWARTDVDEFLTGAQNTVTAEFWNQSYNGITRCNILLNRIDLKPIVWDNELVKERSIGEAKFLRALYYFNLVRLFGGVPIVLEPIGYEEAVNVKRSVEEDVYKQIIQDLEGALVSLEKAASIEESGRATHGAALSLLGKVYLTRQQYADAETVLKKVIDKNQYRLLGNYADLFDNQKKNHAESIFAVQYSEANANLSQRFIFEFAPQSSLGAVTQRPAISIISSGWNIPSSDLLESFEPNDARKEVSIGTWTGAGKDGVVRPFTYCNKYKAPVSAPDARCGDNFMILRYADVLLMYAEALNEQGKSGNAIQYVQQVRTRAGLTKALESLDQTTLRTLIAKERQIELCFENHRWFDLIRTGKALEVMAKHGLREKKEKPYLSPNAHQIAAHKLLFPIPTQQIISNKLEQNPGY